MSPDAKITVFYDGNCALCHGLVKFALPRDKKNLIYFAPIQGETYTNKFGKFIGEPQTVIVQTPTEKLLDRSDAILFIMTNLDGIYHPLAKLLGILPKSLRDFVYNTVSRTRLKLFGKSESLCPIIPQDVRSKLLP